MFFLLDVFEIKGHYHEKGCFVQKGNYYGKAITADFIIIVSASNYKGFYEHLVQVFSRLLKVTFNWTVYILNQFFSQSAKHEQWVKWVNIFMTFTLRWGCSLEAINLWKQIPPAYRYMYFSMSSELTTLVHLRYRTCKGHQPGFKGSCHIFLISVMWSHNSVCLA